MKQIYVPLPEHAVDELRRLAEREYRGTKEQAAWLILDGLHRAAEGRTPSTDERRALVAR